MTVEAPSPRPPQEAIHGFLEISQQPHPAFALAIDHDRDEVEGLDID
ncbi:hypothetical protein [Brevundimonas sp.]